MASRPFELSRSKLEDFLRCPRCFYLDRRGGIGKPSIPGYTLNQAVDTLLKKEFDRHRRKGTPHPLMRRYGIEAIPYAHADLNRWRENFVGVQYHHQPTNLIIFGAVDDLWLDQYGELIVVDYKSTSKAGPVSLSDPYKDVYKRQMEIYQWLFRRNGFNVSEAGYFVYANGRTSPGAFNSHLDFEMTVLPYVGTTDWVEYAVFAAHECLIDSKLPPINENCEYCLYRQAASMAEEGTVAAVTQLT